LFNNIITPFLIVVEIRFKKVWEKEDFENRKHDEQLNKNDSPECTPKGHALESIVVKMKYAAEYVAFHD
jgi:hypothetical protein